MVVVGSDRMPWAAVASTADESPQPPRISNRSHSFEVVGDGVMGRGKEERREESKLSVYS